MEDVMIDLETLGNTATSAVVQIGACYFDRKTGEIGKTFKININPQSEINWKFEVTGSTIMWWLGQEEEARKSISKKGVVAKEAWKSFNEFLKGSKYQWSHATFDIPIVNYHLAKLNIYPSYSFRGARDLRTLEDLKGPSTLKREGTYHDALDDAIYQAKCAASLL